MSERKLVMGVDIGGTKIAAGLVDSDGNIVRQLRHPMVANRTPEAGLQAVIEAIDTLASADGSSSTFDAIGICAPGPLDPKTGIILNPPNVPCWRNYPLAEKVSSRYKQPVKVDNDGNAAALAETLWGAAKGYRYVFYATLGTGIGSGIVIDGKIYHGRTGSAAEGGHVSIDYNGPVCGCGKRGCIEALASGPAIGKRAQAKVAADPARAKAILDAAKGGVVASEHVGQAFAVGDPLAREILKETVDLLTAWLGNIVDLLDPDVIVMGGGVSAMIKPFFADMKANLPSRCVNPHVSEIPLVMARYGADAGIAGGAALCA